jgi:multidrug efflux pump subunit AcrA (membrane-fusion protein)
VGTGVLMLAALVAGMTGACRPGPGPVRQTAVATKGSVARRTLVPGTLTWRTRATPVVPVAGRVARVLVERGARVSRGDLLFELESRRQSLAVRRRRLEVTRARARLAAEPAGATRELQQIELQQAVLDLEEATQALDDTRIRSPIDGIVVQLSVRAGDAIPPSTPGGAPAVVVSPGDLAVDVEADEHDLAGLDAGTPATVLFETGDEPPVGAVADHEARLRRPRTGSAGALFGLTFRLTSDGVPQKRVGTTVRVELSTAEVHNVLVVPLSALFATPEGEFVLEERRARLHPRRVLLGLSDAHVAEVRSGLTEGARVVLDTPARLAELFASASEP